MRLTGRRVERGMLDQFVEAIRAGESRALVICGEPGVGKTALLNYLAEQAAECRVLHATGVQSEMELAFAAVHQLCSPILEEANRLPAPQRDALRTAFGLSSGAAPDKFLIGLAVLNLLSEVAEQRPLVCVVDDEQWIDRTSAQILGFVARRLVAESVGLVFAARVPSDDLAGLPERVLAGLPAAEARILLENRAHWTAGWPGARSHHCRDAGKPLGTAGIIAWREVRSAGGRVWASRRGPALGEGRGKLSAADRGAPNADPTSVACRGGGSGRRSRVGESGSHAIGDRWGSGSTRA